MSEQKPNRSNKQRRLPPVARASGARETVVSVIQEGWRLLISVDSTFVEDRYVRQGELLNTLIAAATLISLGVLFIVGVGYRYGYLESPAQSLRLMLFPFGIMLLGAVSFWLCKRGSVRAAIRLYVWVTLVAVVAGAGIINGYRSASWLLVIWPVALAGSLLSPSMGLGCAIGALVVYSGLTLVQGAGWYVPIMSTPLESFPFFSLAFGWLMIVIAVALVNAINGTHSQGTFDQLSEASRALDASQRELSVRVAERTAELQTRAEQFRAIAELGQAAASMAGRTTADPDAFLNRAVTLISERLGFYHVGLFLLDREHRWAVLRAASSAGGQRMMLRGHRLRVGQQGIVGYVAERGVPRYALHVDQDAAWVQNPDLPDTKSEIGLPLMVGARVIGVLDMQTRQPAAFGEPDLETFRVLADAVAVALENERLFQETQEAMAQLQRYQSSDAVSAWREALARRRMQVAFDYALGETQPSNSGTLGADAAAEVGGSSGGLPDLSTVQGVTQIVGDDGSFLLLAPVSVGGRRLGALTFERTSPWSDEAVRLVTSVVNQLDLALSNARLLEETRLRARQEAARSEIVGRIRAMTSTDAILRNAAEELGRALQVERSRIQLHQFADVSSHDS